MTLSQRRTALVERLKRGRTRAREGLVLVEGVRAVQEAIDGGAELRFAIVSDGLGRRGAATELREALEGRDVVGVTDGELLALSATEHPQGVLAVCGEPVWEISDLTGRRFLVLDAVQDPGNVGTLVRAAVAFALDGVVCLDGTADPWEPKAVRAAAGMTFRLPVVRAGADAARERLRTLGVPLIVADASGTPIGRDAPTEAFAVVVGNEGAGVRPTLREVAERRVSVRMPGPAESLNVGVAGSILVHALTSDAEPGETDA